MSFSRYIWWYPLIEYYFDGIWNIAAYFVSLELLHLMHIWNTGWYYKSMGFVYGILPVTNVHKVYVDLGVLSVKCLYSYKEALFMYRDSNNMRPSLFDYFFWKFQLFLSIIRWNVHRSFFMWIPQQNSMIRNCCTTIWNFSLNKTE